MRVNQIQLANFRNYAVAGVKLNPGKNIFIGENAQGKTNFLEVIEMAATGRSARATRDGELIRWGQDNYRILVGYERAGNEESIALALNAVRTPGGMVRFEKQIKINGVTYNSYRKLLGRIVVVSFKSQDLDLLRGGPKYRRLWLDEVVLRVKPAYQETLSNYARVLTQRNRFLKGLAEKGRVAVSDQDALSAWDTQLARFGSQIIKQRLKLLDELLPAACAHLLQISGQSDALDAEYIFKAGESADQEIQEIQEAQDIAESEEASDSSSTSVPVSELKQATEEDIMKHLLKLLKERRAKDIWRRQTLTGPHRDDISFSINKSSATTFASQGQQRSLVLALKLAELDYVTVELGEAPILLLDDVLAELDLLRQGALMSSVPASMQTIITTTHLAGFDPRWLEGATIYNVSQGVIVPEPTAVMLNT